MTNLKITMITGAMSLALSSCAITPTQEEHDASFQRLTIQDFSSSILIEDDPLEPAIRISTQNGFQDYLNIFMPKNDQFLRGMKFRDSGNIVLQGYVTNEDYSDWFQPYQITFLHGLTDRSVERVHFDARCSSVGCSHFEDAVFNFTLEELNTVIDGLEKLGVTQLEFRIHGRSGRNRDGRFHLSELIAFRDAVLSEF